MTTRLLPIDIEPGVDLAERIRTMTDDEFFYFCQENNDRKFERDVWGNIKIMAQTGGETGERNSELAAELIIWNRVARLGYVYNSSKGFRLPNGATQRGDLMQPGSLQNDEMPSPLNNVRSFHHFARILLLN